MPDALLAQDGSCSRAVAGARTLGRSVGCAGNCWQAPASSQDGGATWEGSGQVWRRPGDVRVLERCGRFDPLALQPDAYASLDRALSMDGADLLALVTASGLRGRGGAYFPVGAKWQTARATAAARRFLLVNAEEGEPGVYKDRHLLEGDPHRIVAGMQVAAHAIAASDIVLMMNGSARLAQQRMLAALEQARELGLAPVPVEVRLGAGGYVLGEETTLINAIHGFRSEPLARPPFPAVSGLWGCPTVVNNVETLANLPDIVLYGVDWFRSLGTAASPGTKLVSLAGDVRHPGLYEVALGTSLRHLVEVCGGGVRGRLGAMLVGGPSGSVLPAALADTPLDVTPLQAVGGILGAGGVVVLSHERCIVQMVREQVAFNARESCGKCTPCREGTVRLVGLYDQLASGAGTPAVLETMTFLNDVIGAGSLCGLGQMAPNPVRGLLRYFAAEVGEHMHGECRAAACQFGGAADRV